MKKKQESDDKSGVKGQMNLFDTVNPCLYKFHREIGQHVEIKAEDGRTMAEGIVTDIGPYYTRITTPSGIEFTGKPCNTFLAFSECMNPPEV